jgi:very-short-patch-repair endonuclease
LESKLAKQLWQDPSFRSRVAAGRAKMMGRPSRIEKTTSNILSSIGVAHKQQVPFGPYVYDFLIPEKNLFIEVQGEYWHSSVRAMARDESKRKYLSDANPGSRLLYLHERDFLNPHVVRQKLVDALYGGANAAETDPFELDDVDIFDIPPDQAREFLNAFHYAQFGRASKLCVGARIGSDVVAVCKFSTVIRKQVATSMGENTSQVLELDRMAIHPRRHRKNFASWFVSRCSKRVFKKFSRVTTLVSFADTSMGHVGTVYAAAGWKLVSTVPPDYHYVNSDGWMMHKKTLYNHAVQMKMREREYAEKFRYVKVTGKCKLKFRIDRGKNV